jgi:hypothetical protein
VKPSGTHIDIGVLFTNASLLTGDTMDADVPTASRLPLSFDGLKHHESLRGVPGRKQADEAFHCSRTAAIPSTPPSHPPENRDKPAPTPLPWRK